MDFFKKKVRGFQEKKLNEICEKIKFHEHVKSQLEKRIIGTEDSDTSKIIEEIAFNKKMIEIWQKNENKLRKQMREMEE